MHLALVHDWLTGMRGGEKCLEVLCRRFPDARLLTLLHRRGSTAPAIERMAIRTSFLQYLPGATRYYRWLLPLMPTAAERLPVPAGVDAVVSFSHAVAKGVRVPRGVPHVCYCFTPMRYAWHRRDDYVHAGPLDRLRGRLLDRIRDWDRATSDRVTHFVAISHTVAQRIQECYGRESRVLYPPVDTRFYTPAGVPRDDYYLCVSALAPYKRLDLAIEACRRLGRRLLVIGDGPMRRRLQQQAGPNVQLLGWRTSEEIRDHLRRCRALLFPGHEDFGIVPLEAQACGTPVIALAEGGATETVLPASAAHAGTGWWFDQPTSDALCGAIEEFERHSDWFSASLARRQAERFALERYEREFLDLLDVLVGPTPRQALPIGLSGYLKKSRS